MDHGAPSAAGFGEPHHLVQGGQGVLENVGLLLDVGEDRRLHLHLQRPIRGRSGRLPGELARVPADLPHPVEDPLPVLVAGQPAADVAGHPVEGGGNRRDVAGERLAHRERRSRGHHHHLHRRRQDFDDEVPQPVDHPVAVEREEVGVVDVQDHRDRPRRRQRCRQHRVAGIANAVPRRLAGPREHREIGDGHLDAVLHQPEVVGGEVDHRAALTVADVDLEVDHRHLELVGEALLLRRRRRSGRRLGHRQRQGAHDSRGDAHRTLIRQILRFVQLR